MGWIGLGALIASVSYLLYKHPPTTWAFLTIWRKRIRPLSKKDDTPTIPQSGQSSPTESHEESPGGQGESKQKQETNLAGNTSPETTPKAKAAHDSAPNIDVPTLNLDGASKSDKDDLSIPEPNDYMGHGNSASKPPAATLDSNITTKAPTPTSTSSAMKPPSQKPQSSSTPNGQSNLMPPPPRPPTISSLRPPPSAASNLRASPSRSAGTSSLMPPPSASSMLSPQAPQKPSRKVILEPGHSPLDWAALTSDPRNNLRGANLPPTLIRVTPTMLKAQNGRKGRDAWTSFRGKVYNITPYVPFHPGGKGEILRGAGKDSEKLFMETHPWVNWDGMLGECLVGILVSDNDSSAAHGSALDEMD